MSKLLKNFIGIDISKKYFDAAIISSNNSEKIVHKSFNQTMKGYEEFQSWLNENKVLFNDETLVCMEFTGLYNHGLVTFLVTQKSNLWVEMPLRIKKSSGLERGDNDKLASIKIAKYAFRYQEQKKLWKPIDLGLAKIKEWVAQRERIMNTITVLEVPVNEIKECGANELGKELEKMQSKVIKQAKKTKEDIEKKIRNEIAQDEELTKKINQLKSVKGVGEVTAVALLVYTKGFTSFNSAKELASYCSVVPFSKSSGSSVRYKPSVSPFANKKLKKLLHMCVLSAIKNDKEMTFYFLRKVAEGKNKMSVINAVRNKIVHRIFAAVRDNRIFEEDYVRTSGKVA